MGSPHQSSDLLRIMGDLIIHPPCPRTKHRRQGPTLPISLRRPHRRRQCWREITNPKIPKTSQGLARARISERLRCRLNALNSDEALDDSSTRNVQIITASHGRSNETLSQKQHRHNHSSQITLASLRFFTPTRLVPSAEAKSLRILTAVPKSSALHSLS